MILSNDELCEFVCADCTQEGMWEDADCRACRRHMIFAAKAQATKIIEHIEGNHRLVTLDHEDKGIPCGIAIYEGQWQSLKDSLLNNPVESNRS